MQHGSMSMMTAVRMKAVGDGGYSYNRGPTFFSEQGSKSGPDSKNSQFVHSLLSNRVHSHNKAKL